MVSDAANDLLDDKSWDPSEACSDHARKIPAAKKLSEEIPFARAMSSCADLDSDVECKSDVFIDDLISIGVDNGNDLSRLIAAPCTVMRAIARKAEGEIFLKRDDFIAEDKIDAEGAPEECKTCLGWLLNTRALTASLPFHKLKAWSSQVRSFVARKSANEEDLQSVLGRMENLAIAIPMFSHFLNSVRHLETKAAIAGKAINK